MLLGNVRHVADVGVRYRRHVGGISQGPARMEMNLAAIERQFHDDLAIAERETLRSPAELAAIRRSVESYWARRKTLALAQQGSLSLSSLAQYLTGPTAGFRDRFSVLKAWLKVVRS